MIPEINTTDLRPVTFAQIVILRCKDYLRELSATEYRDLHCELYRFFLEFDAHRAAELKRWQKLCTDLVNTTPGPIVFPADKEEA